DIIESLNRRKVSWSGRLLLSSKSALALRSTGIYPPNSDIARSGAGSSTGFRAIGLRTPKSGIHWKVPRQGPVVNSGICRPSAQSREYCSDASAFASTGKANNRVVSYRLVGRAEHARESTGACNEAEQVRVSRANPRKSPTVHPG